MCGLLGCLANIYVEPVCFLTVQAIQQLYAKKKWQMKPACFKPAKVIQ